MQEIYFHLPVLLKTSGEASILILLVLAAQWALRAAPETALALRPVVARSAAPGFAVDNSFSGQPFQCC